MIPALAIAAAVAATALPARAAEPDWAATTRCLAAEIDGGQPAACGAVVAAPCDGARDRADCIRGLAEDYRARADALAARYDGMLGAEAGERLRAAAAAWTDAFVGLCDRMMPPGAGGPRTEAANARCRATMAALVAHLVEFRASEVLAGEAEAL